MQNKTILKFNQVMNKATSVSISITGPHPTSGCSSQSAGGQNIMLSRSTWKTTIFHFPEKMRHTLTQSIVCLLCSLNASSIVKFQDHWSKKKQKKQRNWEYSTLTPFKFRTARRHVAAKEGIQKLLRWQTKRDVERLWSGRSTRPEAKSKQVRNTKVGPSEL